MDDYEGLFNPVLIFKDYSKTDYVIMLCDKNMGMDEIKERAQARYLETWPEGNPFTMVLDLDPLKRRKS